MAKKKKVEVEEVEVSSTRAEDVQGQAVRKEPKESYEERTRLRTWEVDQEVEEVEEVVEEPTVDEEGEVV
jgi:hypothetical protein